MDTRFAFTWLTRSWPPHRCGLGITSLLLTQRTRVRSPVGSVSRLRFFLRFSLNRKTDVRKFGSHSSPVIIYHSKLYIIHLRTATVSGLNCSRWPSLYNKEQQHEKLAVCPSSRSCESLYHSFLPSFFRCWFLTSMPSLLQITHFPLKRNFAIVTRDGVAVSNSANHRLCTSIMFSLFQKHFKFHFRCSKLSLPAILSIICHNSPWVARQVSLSEEPAT